ncbi:MAG TPA: hypothetical protein VKS22_02275 [Candidatus Binataceae bacterium]|nr:hypothetical protein [Candidatus Binataceae bacterium]
MAKRILGTMALICGLVLTTGSATHAVAADSLSFNMVVSSGAATCLPNATATVTLSSLRKASVEKMVVKASGLPPKTDFDFFVIQVPNKPFGLAWYQGDLETNGKGKGSQTFIGRFQIETFIIGFGVADAPQTFPDPPFPDALQNPETLGPDGVTPGPVQTYHLGMWFNSATDAQNAGCPNTVTPFNGVHNAGIQVLNTSNFPDTAGPLSGFTP